MSIHPFRKWREARGLTQEAAGNLLGLTGSAVGHIERGRCFTLPRTTGRIAALTGGAVGVVDMFNFHAEAAGGPKAEDVHPFMLWRYEHGLSAADAAREAGTSAFTIYRVENGETKPTYRVAQQLSDVTKGLLNPDLIRQFWTWKRNDVPIEGSPYAKEEDKMRPEKLPNTREMRMTSGRWAGRRALIFRCTSCGRERPFVPKGVRLPPGEVLHKNLAREGWAIARGGRKQICPSCVATRKASGNGEIMEAEPEQEAAEAAAPDMTRAQRREAFKLLYQHFDPNHFGPERGRYRPGHSDATIAKALGVPTEQLTAFREENVGALAVDADLDRTKKRLDHIETQVKELEERATGVAEDILDRLDKLQKQLTETRRMLEAGSADANA